MEFKDRLIKLRKELNLTQEELAQKIGYTRTAISAWEIGRNEPSNADTIKLAEYFGVSTDYLLGKSDVRNPEKVDIDKADVAFASGIKGLNETNQMIIKNTIEALLAKQEKDIVEYKKAYNNVMLSALFVFLPILVIGIACSFANWLPIYSFGTILFWGIFVMALYHASITRVLFINSIKSKK